MQAAVTSALSTAERSYPTSDVRGRSREDPMPEGQWPRGVTRRWRPGAAAERRYPLPEARGIGRSHPASQVRGGGQEEQPHTRGQGQRPGRATNVQEVLAALAQEGLEELSHIESQEGQREEIPLIQGKEQGLCFAGAAVKRYPKPKVRETQVRW